MIDYTRKIIKEKADAVRKVWQKEVGHRLDERSEEQRLLLEHFFDDEEGQSTPHHHIQFTKRRLHDIKNHHDRMIYILIKSGELTTKQIAGGLPPRNVRTVKRSFRRSEQIFCTTKSI